MTDKPAKTPFVPQADRPEVGRKADARLSDLTGRDLVTMLGQTRKDFWDGTDWQKADFDGLFEDGFYGPRSKPDPRIDQVIGALSGISAKVDQLADQIDALKRANR